MGRQRDIAGIVRAFFIATSINVTHSISSIVWSSPPISNVERGNVTRALNSNASIGLQVQCCSLECGNED